MSMETDHNNAYLSRTGAFFLRFLSRHRFMGCNCLQVISSPPYVRHSGMVLLPFVCNLLYTVCSFDACTSHLKNYTYHVKGFMAYQLISTAQGTTFFSCSIYFSVSKQKVQCRHDEVVGFHTLKEKLAIWNQANHLTRSRTAKDRYSIVHEANAVSATGWCK